MRISDWSSDVCSSDLIGPGGAIVPFRLLASSADNEREYLTDEFQIFGKAFDDKLDWIVGAFYSKDKNSGPSGSNYTAFVTNVLGINPNTYTTSLNENRKDRKSTRLNSSH